MICMSELAAESWSGIWKRDSAYNAALCVSLMHSQSVGLHCSIEFGPCFNPIQNMSSVNKTKSVTVAQPWSNSYYKEPP